ncbi:MAG: 5-(carboxyamino)imidazole ribonucleotide mutase [Leptospira sp.]|nr:MAG: 5-(carboxyamino)imidazole ribonucleotide mutase [Leptospira sp.]
MSNEKMKVAVIMGSHSDWETMKEACLILDSFSIAYDKKIVSAHRSPDLLYSFSKSARETGYSLIIAGAGGAAHLPGMVASLTTLPVLGVPIQSKALSGVDSLYSIVQMPKGIPVGTLAIGSAGAANAGLLAVRILSLLDPRLDAELQVYQAKSKTEALAKEKDLLI